MLGFSNKIFKKSGLEKSSPVSVEKVANASEQVINHLGLLLSAAKKANRVTRRLDLYEEVPGLLEAVESTAENAADNIDKVAKQLMFGGLADKVDPKTFNQKELAMGIKIESEHTNSKALAKEIASDHLAEHGNYYSALKKMEAGLEKESKEKLFEVATIAVTKGDKMLWGKRRDSKKWTTPGGGIEEGEKPITAAVRELEEEAGINLKERRLEKITAKVITSELGEKIKVHGFKASVPNKTKTTIKNDPDKEVKRWTWAPIKDKSLPKEVIDNMHAKKNVLLEPMGIKETVEKTAGGPGSGSQEDNTKKIECLPMTKYITIMKRTAFMKSKKPFIKNKKIKLSKIKFVGQEKYVPKKLAKFVKAIENGETWPYDKAIDVTVDKNGDYAVLDGHHRFLAAKHFGKKDIKANIYTVNNKDITEETLEKQAFIAPFMRRVGASALTKMPGAIHQAFQKGKVNFTKGKLLETGKDAAKGTYNLALGGKTVNKKWDPLYGVKSMGKARERYTSGPLKDMYKYTDEGDHVLDLGKKRNWKGFMKDEFSGASATRGDLAAKQLAKQKQSLTNPDRKMNVGEYLGSASGAEKQHLASLNKMKVTDFIKKHPKLAANYYGRNAVQKGLTVGFPVMALNDIRTGASNELDPESSNLGNTMGSLAEAGGWAMSGPLGIAGALGAVTGLKGGAKMVGNLISNPKEAPKMNFRLSESPNAQMYDRMYSNAPRSIQQPIQQVRQAFTPQILQGNYQ